jgi:hypothetical protein
MNPRGTDMAIIGGGAGITAGTVSGRCLVSDEDAARIPGRPESPTAAVVVLIGH